MMAKVVISHKLHDNWMAVLEKAGMEVAIINNGNPKVMCCMMKV
jgi:D-3-phosphoglycerate dehydrogenase